MSWLLELVSRDKKKEPKDIPREPNGRSTSFDARLRHCGQLEWCENTAWWEGILSGGRGGEDVRDEKVWGMVFFGAKSVGILYLYMYK
jgi:hypothetical protein